MEYTKKTTILLPPYLHERLTSLAAQQGTSMGSLIREACLQVYGASDRDIAVAAVHALGALSVPVDSAASMKAEYVVEREPLA
jgi:predicted DNA-binding protein